MRAQVRRERYAFVRSSWHRLLLIPVLFLASAAGGLAFARDDFQRGVLVGGAVVGAVGVTAYLVTHMTGTGPRSMGALAEVWSATELRRLRGHGFKVVNHVMLTGGDIDHVLVGPRGCWAVETKWSASPWTTRAPDEWITRAVEQARANARSLRLWTEFRRTGVDTVGAVVMLWGSAADGVAPCSDVDGVTVVRGAEGAAVWRKEVLGLDERIDAAAVGAAWGLLAKQAALRDAREDDGPPSAERVAGLAISGLGAGLVGFLSTLQVMVWIATSWDWVRLVASVLAGLGLAACGLPVRRWASARPAGTAWVTGALCAVVAAIAGVVLVL